LRPKFAPLAVAACVALNLYALQPSVAYAQLNLPALGEAESDQFSIDDEKKVGEQIMREIRPDPDVVDDPVLSAYLMSIFEPLHQAAIRRGNISPEAEEAFAWEPFLVRDRSFNAFALPGGYIGVNLGLIAASGSRDEMASVLGHELSHITQRHIARSMVANKHQSIVSIAAMLLGLLASVKSRNSDVPMAVLATGQASMATGQLTFSRAMESEADRFGLDVMTDAGFAPSGMADMFQRLETASQLNDNNQYPWLRSHPLTIERLSEARLRARQVAPPDPRYNHITEHALMRARARALMDTSDVALRRMQSQARLNIPLDDSDRLGTLYGGALASIELHDFPAAAAMLDDAQQVLARHATTVAQKEHGAAPPSVAASAATGGADVAAPDGPVRVIVTAPAIYPIEPVVAHDFELLRVEYAVAKRSTPEIVAALDVLGNDHTRPTMLARADAAIARAAARDPGAGVALQRETEALQTWVAEHPRDALAWTLLAQCAEPLGQKLRAIRAEAEAHAANGDLLGAIDRLHAGQRLTRTGRVDFVEASIIDSRLHELEAERRALGKDLHDAEHP
jgi:predicted Zn-dependent protease